ncbi:hypothetical protein HDU78_010086 [Chytriomyces hyalinus]|nr:hypothetical protein HDU78_010086 [Chytriomyces hyalinus]
MHRFKASMSHINMHPISPANTPPASNESLPAPPTTDTRRVKRDQPVLTTEQKARNAINNALTYTPSLDGYTLHSVIGFGANGVVIAAEQPTPQGASIPVAIKIIYKPKNGPKHPSTASDPIPNEILTLRAIARASNHKQHPTLLRYISDHQDAFHFYLVTELFGSDWLALVRSVLNIHGQKTSSQTLVPLVHRGKGVTLQFSNGSADLWAWSYFERCANWDPATGETAGLPGHLVKKIIGDVCSGLHHLHALGMYHGDIKSENVLVTAVNKDSLTSEVQVGGAQGDYHIEVRICDFGHTESRSTGVRNVGTLDHAPPEYSKSAVQRGVFVDGAKADVYALGLMATRLLASSGMFSEMVVDMDNMLGMVRDGVIEGMSELELVDDLLKGMLCDEPEARFSMEQVLTHPWFD